MSGAAGAGRDGPARNNTLQAAETQQGRCLNLPNRIDNSKQEQSRVSQLDTPILPSLRRDRGVRWVGES
jgi:hypothetical protein